MQRGLTLEDVARNAQIDMSTLSRLESGKRRLALDHLPRLAAALSVSTDELMRAPEAEDPRVRGSSFTTATSSLNPVRPLSSRRGHRIGLARSTVRSRRS
jgi:transcriptional regulator with XRE-family HTH domain